MRHGSHEREQSFSFYRTARRGFRLKLAAWVDVTLSRPLPLSREEIKIRVGPHARPRISFTPPWPLDFTLHIYDSPQLPVRTILTALKIT
jgi:hypothetical protein